QGCRGVGAVTTGFGRLAIRCRPSRAGVGWARCPVACAAWLFAVALPGLAWGGHGDQGLAPPGYSLSPFQGWRGVGAVTRGLCRLAIRCRPSRAGVGWAR